MNSKSVAILLVISFGMCVHGFHDDIEPCDKKDVGKLKPDTKNCSDYYECTLAGWVSMPCPTGLNFNPQTSLCDYPENVKCATELDEYIEPCDYKDLDKLKPDPKNCSRFYECALAGWVSLSCPTGLHFNPQTSLCDYPENVKCATELHDTLNESIEPCDAKDIDKLKPDPKNCSRFYECAQVGWVSLPCPTGLHFNPQTSLCDYPENVKCSTELHNILNLKYNVPCDLRYDPLYKPVPWECSRFFQCTPWGYVSMPCPLGLYFNPAISVCDWPKNVHCNT